MDNKKKAEFVKAMGRQNFSKGGMIRKLGNRKYFAAGGAMTANGGGTNTALGGPETATVNTATNPNTGILGTIGGALGLNNNFQAGAANTQAGTNSAQLGQAYNGTQNALAQQANLTNTLAPQALTGVQNQNVLAQQLSQMAQGQGPNPAQAELAQATNQNVGQTSAEMAGARGANQNVGLMARQIGQQGAQTQQQAAGQAATLEAQQQIAAQQNLANLSAAQIGQTGQGVTGLNTAQQNEQAQLQNANNAYNNAQVGMQSNINSTNAQTAQGNQGVFGSLLGGIGGGASSAISGIASMFDAKGGVVESPDHIKLAEMNAHSIAHGKKMMASGGAVDPIIGNPLLGNQSSPQAQSFVGQYTQPQSAGSPNVSGALAPSTAGNSDLKNGITTGLNSLAPTPADPIQENTTDPFNSSGAPSVSQLPEAGTIGQHLDPGSYAHGGKIAKGPHKSHVANFMYADGGKVKAMVSPGEVYLSPDKVHKVINEGIDPLKIGKLYKGKAKVKGDSLKNDFIPDDLEEGGVVIDRNHMGSREKRELFVHKALAKHKAGR